jgi:hypothetical protein
MELHRICAELFSHGNYGRAAALPISSQTRFFTSPFLYHEYGDCVLLLEHGLQVNNVSHITLCLAEIWSLLVYLNSMIAPFFL